MTYMLCRNRVADFAKSKVISASHAQADKHASLRLVKLWRGIEDLNEAFFLFEVGDMEKAQEFISNPGAAKASGVIEGYYHFLEDAEGY